MMGTLFIQKPGHVQEDIGCCGSGSERSTLHGKNVEKKILGLRIQEGCSARGVGLQRRLRQGIVVGYVGLPVGSGSQF